MTKTAHIALFTFFVFAGYQLADFFNELHRDVSRGAGVSAESIAAIEPSSQNHARIKPMSTSKTWIPKATLVTQKYKPLQVKVVEKKKTLDHFAVEEALAKLEFDPSQMVLPEEEALYSVQEIAGAFD